MKYFQPLFVIFLSFFVTVLAQDNCDAICNERIQPVQAEKDRAEEWGRGLQTEVEDLRNKLGAAEGQANEFRALAEQHERVVVETRQHLEGAQRDLEESKRAVDQARSESGQALSRAETELAAARQKIQDMESTRISINFKGIQEDAKVYWQKLLTWWTGLIQPKAKDEDL